MKRTETPKTGPLAPRPDQLLDLSTWVGVLSTGGRPRFAPLNTAAAGAGQPCTLYLETTIFSYLTARLNRDAQIYRDQAATRVWWQMHRARYVSYTSELARDEAQRGDAEAARRRLAALSSLAFVHASEQSHELAAKLLAACRLPARAYDAAHHIALASLNRLEVLLTWNRKHLANVSLTPLIRNACEGYGYMAPAICTPEQLVGECAYEGTDTS